MNNTYMHNFLQMWLGLVTVLFILKETPEIIVISDLEALDQTDGICLEATATPSAYIFWVICILGCVNAPQVRSIKDSCVVTNLSLCDVACVTSTQNLVL